MMLSGKVNFKGVNRILPKPSCLFVTMADISRMDAPSTVITSKRFDLSAFDTSIGFYEYEIRAKKPAKSQLRRSYSMSALLHVGRCPEKREVVNKGDILSDTTHSIKLKESQNEYTKDINTICYGKSRFIPKINKLFKSYSKFRKKNIYVNSAE